MRQFPLIARIYIWVVTSLGIIVFGGTLWAQIDDRFLVPPAWSDLPVLIVGCILTLIAARPHVTLFKHTRLSDGDGRATMSLSFVPTFFLLMHLGSFAGMLAAICSVAVFFFVRHRPHFHQIVFSTAAMFLSSFVAGLILQPFGLAPGVWDVWKAARLNRPGELFMPLLGMGMAITAYYLVNTALVASVIALTSKQNPLRVWLKHFLWTGPGFFAGGSCAAVLLAILPHILGTTPNVLLTLTALLVGIPIPTVIYFVYKYHSEMEEANEARIEGLRRSTEDLERSNTELTRSKEELQKLYTSTVESLALAIDAKDRYTKEHIQRVKGFAVHIAVQMGLTGDDLKAVETGALLHDIGKLAVPEHILTKPGRLSDEEFAKVKTHPDMGARILEPVQFPFPVMPIVRHHHEKWDGSGYPDGLVGEAIPLGGRILAVADVYDALTSDRSYRMGWSHERAVAHMSENAGSHFDPQVIEAFLAVLTHHPDLCARGEEAKAAGTPAPIRNGAGRLPASVAAGINRASFEYIALYEISQAVAATLNRSETLTLLAPRIKNIFNVATCALLLKEETAEQGTVLRVRRVAGEHEDLFQDAWVPFGGGVTGSAAQNGRGMIGAFEPSDLNLRDKNGDRSADLFQSVLVAPLIADGSILGTVNLYQPRAGAFDTEDLRVLEAVAVQAGRALQNATEFERTLESALTDSLTGLYNARHLAQFLEKELERSRTEDRALSLLVLDLDNFKPVNDRYGHTRGNEVLRDLGGIFQSVVRGGDLVARYAGDEFVVVLPGAGPAESRVVVDKIRAAVSLYDPSPSGVPDVGNTQIGVSIGTASFPQDGADATTLITVADRAMFRNKRDRKGGILAVDERDKENLRLVA